MSDTGRRQSGLTDTPRTFAGIRAQGQDVAAGSLTRVHLNSRHQYFNFRSQPTAMLKGATGAAAAGTTGAVNILSIPGEGVLEQHILGAGQTLIVPTLLADGLEISGDQTNDEGMELCAGLVSRVASAFLVGSDPAFFFRLRGVIDDVSGTDDFAIGWRKIQAYGPLDDYTDFAVLNLISGQWKTETALNNAATVTTDLGASYTVANLGAFEVQINVSAAGAVTYLVGTNDNMTAPPLAPAYTFDEDDVVVPFVYFLHSGDLADSVRLRQWEAGFQAAAL